MKKEGLLKDFLENSDIILYIIQNNRKTIDYYFKKDGNMESYEDVIEEIVKESFFEQLDGEDINQVIIDIENFENNEYIDLILDDYNKDLIESYFYFEDYEEIELTDSSVMDILKRSQEKGYTELFEDIKREFIRFLER